VRRRHCWSSRVQRGYCGCVYATRSELWSFARWVSSYPWWYLTSCSGLVFLTSIGFCGSEYGHGHRLRPGRDVGFADFRHVKHAVFRPASMQQLRGGEGTTNPVVGVADHRGGRQLLPAAKERRAQERQRARDNDRGRGTGIAALKRQQVAELVNDRDRHGNNVYG
jgi:hypothetical protein